MRGARGRKSSSSVKDGYRQLELDKCFLTCSKKVNTQSMNNVKKMSTRKCSKKLFTEEIIVIKDDDDDEKESVEKKEDIIHEEIISTAVGSVSNINHGENSTAGTSISTTVVETVEILRGERRVISLNRPLKEIRSPQKLKPRVLQSISSETNSFTPHDVLLSNSASPSKEKSMSQNSSNSDDTIIYDPCELQDKDCHLSPTSKLLQKVNENVQATRFSSVAYRRTETKIVESPTKRPGRSVQTEENELSNPRAVSFVTKIVKYVFTQPHFKNLFNEEEIAMFIRFFSLPLPEYNYFCYKLFTRLPRWYNIFRLCENIRLNMDTPQILNMYNCLSSNGFILTDYSSEPVEQLLKLLPVKEIKEIHDSFRLTTKTSTKLQLIENLLKNSSKQTTLTLSKNSNQILRDRISEKLGRCVKLSEKLYDLLYRVHILYALGSSEFSKPHDLYQFIDKIQNGDIILPEYTVDTSPLFNSREEFLKFAKASEYKDELLNAFDSKNRDTMMEISRVVYKHLQDILRTEYSVILNLCASLQPKPAYLLRFTAGAKYTSALSIATKHLVVDSPGEVKEWLKLLLSQHLYCTNKRGFWYDQLAMIETKYLKNYEMGTQTIIEALEDKMISQVALHDLSARGIAMKNSKKYKLEKLYVDKISSLAAEPPDNVSYPSIVIDAKAMQGNESGRKRTYIETQNDSSYYLTNVEQIALNYYKRKGYTKGVHCEGSLLITLFFIFFWDIIYTNNVQSAFINEIQYIPLDLYGEDFYKNRKSDIDERLVQLKIRWSSEVLLSFAVQNWGNHSHKRSLIVSDLIQDAEELTEIISCIGRERLAILLERLAKDFKQFHSGLPDLFVWNSAQKKCLFVEVKGEKDKLSTKQKLWLKYLRMAKADIQVCHVHTIGSKSTKKIAKLREGQTTDVL